MSDAATTDLRALLEQERSDLCRQLDELGFGDGARPIYDSNFADTSQVTAERGEAEALAAKLQATLDDVERALGKIDGGDFGVCENCGKKIAPGRLEAMPAARYCIDCASKR